MNEFFFLLPFHIRVNAEKKLTRGLTRLNIRTTIMYSPCPIPRLSAFYSSPVSQGLILCAPVKSGIRTDCCGSHAIQRQGSEEGWDWRKQANISYNIPWSDLWSHNGKLKKHFPHKWSAEEFREYKVVIVKVVEETS